MYRPLTILTCFLLPLSVQAAVTIHEVAWMGDSVSANHEWIELYNSGDAAVSLDGWILSDGMNLSIPLGGMLGGGDYGVLERTSEESAPGAALLIYTGALVNTGASLQLRDANNGIVDQVAGGENWENIGGDNITKETAQYTPNGWITAPGTPGRVNATIASTPQTATAKSVSTGEWPEGEERAPLVLSRVHISNLVLTPIVPDKVFVGQRVSFSVEASGVGDQFKASLQYKWNFGDTTTGEGERVTHRFAYPGTYVVRVRGSFGMREALGESVVTVLPVSVSLTRSESGDVQLHNDSVYPVDVSLYRIKGDHEVVIPDDTIILPRSTVTVPRRRLESSPRESLVMVYDTTNKPLAWLEPSQSTRLPTTALLADSSVTSLHGAGPYPLLNESMVAEIVDTNLSFVSPPQRTQNAGAVPTQVSEDTQETTQQRQSRSWETGLFFLLLGVIILIWSFPKRAELVTNHL